MMKATRTEGAALLLGELEESEQVVLALLSALGPIPRHGFGTYVAAVDVPHPLTGKLLKTTPARELCDDLEARKLVFRLQDHRILVPASLAHAALSRHAHHAALDKLLAIVGTRSRLSLSHRELDLVQYQTPLQGMAAHVRILLYRNQTAAASAVVAQYDETLAKGLRHAPPSLWLDVIPQGSPTVAYALLPETARATVVQHGLRFAYQNASYPDPSVLVHAWETPELRLWVVVLECLMEGPTPAHLAGIDKATGVQAHQARMFVALHLHDHARARAFAADAVAEASAEGKRAMDALGAWAGVTLFVLGTGNEQQQKATRAFLRTLPKKRHGEAIIAFDLLNEDSRDYGERLDIVMSVLDCVRLSALDQSHVFLGTQMKEQAAALRHRGFPWLAQQCEHLAAAFSGRKTAARAREGLVALCSPKADWELALDGLDAIDMEPSVASATGAAADKARERLAFEISLRSETYPPARRNEVLASDQPDTLDIRPRVQVQKNGGWSKGRDISPRALSESGSGRFDDELDRRVLATLQVHSHSAHVRFTDRSAVSLVGHPRVFWSDAKEVRPAEVVRRSAELLVREGKHGLCLRVHPPVNEAGVGCYRDTGDRLVVVELDNEACAIADRLIDLPPVPPAGRARLEQLVQRLAGRFAVRSDVELSHLAEAVRSVEPDSRPLIELRRAEPGLRVRVCTQPLDGGPQFAPGIGERLVVAETADGRAQCQRDLNAERAAFDRLCDAVASLKEAARAPVRIGTLDECLSITKALNDLGDQIRVHWPEGEPLSIVAHANLDSLRMRVVEQGEWLSVHGTIAVDGAAVVDILNTFQTRTAGGQFVALPEGGYLSLSPEVAQALDALGAVGIDDGKGTKRKLRLPPVALGFLGSWLRDVGHAEINQRAQERLERIEHAYAQTPALPRTFDAELRPYQQVGFEWLWRLCAFGGGACLADDMGLGKTLMTLALLLTRTERGPSLVVCPTSVRANWVSEAARFAPTLHMVSFEGGMTDALDALGAGDVLVCSYTLMAQRIDALEQRRWSTVVLDEAQSIKNLGAQRTLAAHRLLSDARVALTGTPVENHLGDLYSIMSFLNPGLLGSADHFQQRFAKPIQNDGDARARSQLRTLIAPFMLRRRKSEVLPELPARTEITLRIEPSAQEQAFTEALRRDALARAEAARARGLSSVMLLAEITKLRRAACCPALVQKDADVGTAKLDRAMELIEELRQGNHRALVFSQFVDVLGMLRARCEQAGISHQYLDGSTPEKKRQTAVAQFQSGDGDVFLISLKAGGFGLNLTAADYVIHLDPWWNPAVESQASDRAHRIGQTRPVTVYRLVNAASIEEIVLRLHERKREVAEDILEGTGQTTRLDTNTLLTILEGKTT